MSGILTISDHERAHIAIALEAARKRPTPWAVLQEIASATEGPTLNLDERGNPDRVAAIQREYPSQRVRLGTYEAAISFEEQPAGIMKHLSVSSATPGSVPNQAVMEMTCEAFGFSGFPPTRPHRIWIEEFEPRHHAINVLELEP
jgi:hypothetical protein